MESSQEVDLKTERGCDTFKVWIKWECRITLKLIKAYTDIYVNTQQIFV